MPLRGGSPDLRADAERIGGDPDDHADIGMIHPGGRRWIGLGKGWWR
jgi:hypothetical protein